MVMLDFNLMLDLDALLREGSVVGAARALHISSPAMSRRLARLREAAGDPLFVAAGRGLAPTQRALDMHDRVRATIEEVQSIFLPETLDLSRLERTFTLRASDGFVGAWATQLVTAMMREAPGASLRFVPRADRRTEVLRSGEVDLDIGIAAANDPEIVDEALFEASFVGVVRRGHPLFAKAAGRPGVSRRKISLKQLVAWPHISASQRGSGISRLDAALDAALEAAGLQRRIAIVAPGVQAALVMAATSDFIAAMPEPFARWGQEHHRLQLFALPIVAPVVQVSQSWHKRHQVDPAHRWLREHVRAICGPGGLGAPSRA
jgi:DNA-binding transcriptional LysR family regulator